MKRVIAIAGKPGARTSNLSKQLSQTLGVSALEFGGFVRSLAGKSKDLQTVGHRAVQRMGPVKFLEAFLEHNRASEKDILIIDGVRHVGIWNAIHAKFLRSLLVCIDVPERELVKRLMQRDGLNEQEALKRLTHPVESEFHDLLCVASLVLHAETGNTILREIHSHLTCFLYHSWEEEDVVSKLHTLNAAVDKNPYIPTRNSRRGYYELITEALRLIPFEHHEAAYAIFANAMYLSNEFLSDVNCFLAHRVSHLLQNWGVSLPDGVFAFDVDHSNLAEQLYQTWGVEPELKLTKYNKTPAHLLEGLITINGKTSVNQFKQILSKNVWILTCDNVFSGETLLRDLQMMDSLSRCCSRGGIRPKIVVCTQLFTQQAEQTMLPHKGKLYDEVIYGIRFDESCRITSDRCSVFRSQDTLRKVRRFCEWFAEIHFGGLPEQHIFHSELRKSKRDDYHPLYAYGWRDGGYLVVRQTNTPNNSLPVLWWPQKVRINGKKRTVLGPVAKPSGEFPFPQTLRDFKYRITDDAIRKEYRPPFPREPSFAAYDGDIIDRKMAQLLSSKAQILSRIWE
jgi:cytidylate kinase